MAYVNFATADDVQLAIRPSTRSGTRLANEAVLTALELSAFQLGRDDPLSSIEAPGPIARMLARLFGWQPALPLANPRLEALRRLSVVMRHAGDRLPDQELAHFVNAGFSLAHVRWLRTYPHSVGKHFR